MTLTLIQKHGSTCVVLTPLFLPEIFLEPNPRLTYRTSGGILDFYFFMGPDPESVIQQYTQVSLWIAGWFLCYALLVTVDFINKVYFQCQLHGHLRRLFGMVMLLNGHPLPIYMYITFWILRHFYIFESFLHLHQSLQLFSHPMHSVPDFVIIVICKILSIT